MKLLKCISGGRSGADKTGLKCAKHQGFETGGTAPKGYRTEGGADLTLRDEYGLQESPNSDYAPRTRQNVLDADVTVWFGNCNSPGYWCTRNAANTLKKPMYCNPTPIMLDYLKRTYEVWNIAGNRESKNRAVIGLVEKAFKLVGFGPLYTHHNPEEKNDAAS